jgi:hypothetical protein
VEDVQTPALIDIYERKGGRENASAIASASGDTSDQLGFARSEVARKPDDQPTFRLLPPAFPRPSVSAGLFEMNVPMCR